MNKKTIIILISALIFSLSIILYFLPEKQLKYSNIKIAILDSGINEEKFIFELPPLQISLKLSGGSSKIHIPHLKAENNYIKRLKTQIQAF